VPFGKSLESIVIDVEGNSAEFPYTGSSKLNLIGIMPLGKPPYLIAPDEITDAQKRDIRENTKLVIGHNVLFDLVHLANIHIVFPRARVHDTMIYHKNLYPDELFNGLKALAKKYCKFPHWDGWFASKIGDKKAPLDVNNPEDWRKLCDYNAYDLYSTESLYLKQQRKYTPFSLEMDYLLYVLRMIQNGFHVDKDKLEVLLAETTNKLQQEEQTARRTFALGEDFNFNSHTQVLEWLNRELGAPLTSTGAGALMGYGETEPAIRSLFTIRDLSKLKGTGLEGLKEYLDAGSLVHSSYAVHGAETGRSSSSSPNLQNTDPRVRPLFCSRYQEGRLVHTDLSGIEYRLIGHISQDRNLLKIFNTGQDIHDEMYLALFGVYPPDKVERKKAKTGNFCGVYGGGYKKFLQSTGLGDCAESRKLFDIVSNRYPGVQAWKDGVIRELRRSMAVRSIFGRSRLFTTVDMDAEREAVNWIIQSSGHDILDIYLMELCDRIARAGLEKTLLVSEVHDSVTLDSPKEEFEEAFEIIKELASNLNPLIEEMFGVRMRVPIIADTEVMEHWA
jgi:DNA polymerase-1